jgi:hypothetical protein
MGEFERGQYHGQGVLYNPNKVKWYSGEWRFNKKHGVGAQYHLNGNFFGD